MVCLSTVTFIIGTNQESEQEPRSSNITKSNMDIDGDSQSQSFTEIVDNVAVVFFSLEYFLR